MDLLLRRNRTKHTTTTCDKRVAVHATDRWIICSSLGLAPRRVNKEKVRPSADSLSGVAVKCVSVYVYGFQKPRPKPTHGTQSEHTHRHTHTRTHARTHTHTYSLSAFLLSLLDKPGGEPWQPGTSEAHTHPGHPHWHRFPVGTGTPPLGCSQQLHRYNQKDVSVR